MKTPQTFDIYWNTPLLFSVGTYPGGRKAHHQTWDAALASREEEVRTLEAEVERLKTRAEVLEEEAQTLRESHGKLAEALLRAKLYVATNDPFFAEIDAALDLSAPPPAPQCEECHKTPCECEISEDDYEYGEPDLLEETPPKCKRCNDTKVIPVNFNSDDDTEPFTQEVDTCPSCLAAAAPTAMPPHECECAGVCSSQQENQRLRKALERVMQISCGEIQLEDEDALDDTEALAYLYKFTRSVLAPVAVSAGRRILDQLATEIGEENMAATLDGQKPVSAVPGSAVEITDPALVPFRFLNGRNDSLETFDLARIEAELRTVCDACGGNGYRLVPGARLK